MNQHDTEWLVNVIKRELIKSLKLEVNYKQFSKEIILKLDDEQIATISV